jgi:recombination protein RecA
MTEDERQRIIRQKLCRMEERPALVLSTGLPAVDAALGIGGLPRGRIVELFGAEACGKTALALRTAAETQRRGGGVALIDVERTFDPRQAAALGVNLDSLVVAQPGWEEQALEIARSLAASGAVDLLIVDSAAGLVPKVELESSLEAVAPGLQAAILTRALRRLSAACVRSGTCALFLNQLRSAPGPDGAETTAAGRALKTHAAMRIDLRRIPGSRLMRLRVVRSRLGAASGEADIDVRWIAADA